MEVVHGLSLFLQTDVDEQLYNTQKNMKTPVCMFNVKSEISKSSDLNFELDPK